MLHENHCPAVPNRPLSALRAKIRQSHTDSMLNCRIVARALTENGLKRHDSNFRATSGLEEKSGGIIELTRLISQSKA